MILEDKVNLGAEFDITLSAESGLDVTRAGRVVWLQEEPDGTVVGIEFKGEVLSEPPSGEGGGEGAGENRSTSG